MKKDILINELNTLEKFKSDLVIIEIGTIRNAAPEYEDGDGHSTRHIAEWCKDDKYKHGHLFTSVDIKTDVCAEYLKENTLSEWVYLIEQDGLEYLQSEPYADFIYLDGANDSEQTLEQFKVAVELIGKTGTIVIDDCFPGSTEVVKCHDVIFYCDQNALKYEIENNMLIYRA
jgi:predicted O-methyltransferase YrrM